MKEVVESEDPGGGPGPLRGGSRAHQGVGGLFHHQGSPRIGSETETFIDLQLLDLMRDRELRGTPRPPAGPFLVSRFFRDDVHNFNINL